MVSLRLLLRGNVAVCSRALLLPPIQAREKNPKEINLGIERYLNEFGPTSQESLIGQVNSLKAGRPMHHMRFREYKCPVGIEIPISSAGVEACRQNTGERGEGRIRRKLFTRLERGSHAWQERS